jgi:prolyl 4-hydroxylase
VRLQRYEEGGHYVHHYDWRGGAGRSGTGGSGQPTAVVDRVSSFMVYVDVSEDLVGGGTEFPRLRAVGGEKRWCRFVVCEKERDGDGRAARPRLGDEYEDEYVVGEEGQVNMGVTFKPIKGNAVYWENLRPDGSGYRETWHAGLPVQKGKKIGMNIWSWFEY